MDKIARQKANKWMERKEELGWGLIFAAREEAGRELWEHLLSLQELEN